MSRDGGGVYRDEEMSLYLWVHQAGFGGCYTFPDMEIQIMKGNFQKSLQNLDSNRQSNNSLIFNFFVIF